MVLAAICLPLAHHYRRYALHFAHGKLLSSALLKHLLKLGLYGGVLTFCIYFFMPNFAACECHYARSSIKYDMHTVQTMLETYAADWKGRYPSSVLNLEAEGRRPEKAYWKEMGNICTGERRSAASFKTVAEAAALQPTDIMGFRFEPEGKNQRCLLLYERPEPTRYWIYGFGRDGEPIMDKGTTFILSNS